MKKNSQEEQLQAMQNEVEKKVKHKKDIIISSRKQDLVRRVNYNERSTVKYETQMTDNG